ncbi:heme/hemin ABC transporter substrate-binding protein [Roseibium algae]|uniref:ABC transporter substrate-binding protein n=1 Tax=Roseibium algae TaxID=3123038 RepID=A0ABU8TFB1_9HYPH
MTRKTIRQTATTFFAAISAILLVLSPMAATSAERIVAVGSSVVEIIYALGQGDHLVARDKTSSYPAEALALTDIGYIRALSAEGVLSVNPDLIFLLAGSGPPETIGLLEKAGVSIVNVPDNHTGAAILEKVRVVGEALSVPDRAAELAASIERSIASAKDEAGDRFKDVKIMFVLSAPDGRIMASGANTSADGIIKMTGAKNALSDFNGYKQLSEEAVIQAAPDVILMMDRENHGSKGETILDNPSIALTPAGQNRRLIKMPGEYLLGFGPRTAEVMHELTVKLNAFEL